VRLVRSVTESLRAGEADAALFEGVVLESPLHVAARSEPSRLAADFVLVPLVHRMRRVATGPGQFLAGLSANERSNQKRRLRRLREDFAGAVRFERFADEGEVARLMDEAEAVAKTSYQRGLGVGFVHSPAMRRRLGLEARQGTLRGYVLHVGDRPCAAWITSFRQGVLYNDFLAYDPQFAKYAPGTCLVMHVIEDIAGSAAGTDHITIDFGPGEMEWKARLGNVSRYEATVHVFAPTLKGIALNLARAGCVATARTAKAALERYGVAARIKRAWRTRIAAGR
jgi:hypothetical protein